MSAGTARSQAPSRQGTAGSRRVITRSGRRSRQNQLTSTINRSRRESATADFGETGSDGDRLGRSSDLIDFCGTADIYSEQGWDTDLEEEPVEEKPSKPSNPTEAMYLESCKLNGVIPASYFLRHMHDTTLDMRHHGLGALGIKPVAVALASNATVLELNLMDNWLDQEASVYVTDMLKENCYITHLDLSDNRLGLEFAEQFVGVVMNNSSLTHINLAGNLLDDKAAVFLAEALLQTSKIEYLNLSKNRLGDMAGVALGPAVAENSSLRVLDLSWNSIRRKGAVAFAQGLKQNVLIQVLNLSWNGLALEGAKALADALKVNSVVQQLDIANNRFTTEAAVLFSKCLLVNENLKVLKIGKNPMQSAGCYGICAAILRNPNSTIRQIDFSDILVNNDFLDLYQKVKAQFPELQVRHGGDGVPVKPKANLHPVIKLCNYVERHNVRLTDLFHAADPDHRMRVTRDQFVDGIRVLGIKLLEGELEQVIDELDPTACGEVNYSMLILGQTDLYKKQNAPEDSRSTLEEKLWRK